ncbi:cytochrome c [Pseudidiomarina sp.]|uniref:c-type cytochrome n=1 Tax=Pseudidiomarina sp. TaxID=2081707 RepID=UPI00299E2584|nr:cytochrome c [Pseudidiomarina sp.]MDX1706120.1 cytochrome c [Pseudidiomarina sp.]
MKRLFALTMISLPVSLFADTVTAKTAFYDAEKAVTYRQNALNVMYHNFKTMGDMIKGDVPFESEIFAERASDFAAMTAIPWAGFQVEGAMPGTNTDALPEIWQNWDDFKQHYEQLQTDAQNLKQLATAGASRTELGQAVKTAAESCKGCHDDYRAD